VTVVTLNFVTVVTDSSDFLVTVETDYALSFMKICAVMLHPLGWSVVTVATSTLTDSLCWYVQQWGGKHLPKKSVIIFENGLLSDKM